MIGTKKWGDNWIRDEELKLRGRELIEYLQKEIILKINHLGRYIVTPQQFQARKKNSHIAADNLLSFFRG
jgi:hypothetical protein